MQQDARGINIAGRQRMLSQKIVVGWLGLQQGTVRHESVIQDLEEWKYAHHALLRGADSLNLKVPDSPVTISLLNVMTPKIDFIDSLLMMDPLVFNIELQDKIMSNQSEFLLQMEEVVGLLEKSSDNKLFWAVTIELLLCVTTLFVVWYKLRFIYLPIQSDLEQKNRKYKFLLKELHHRVKNNLNLVSNINYLQCLEEDNEALMSIAEDTANRIAAISRVHDLMLSVEQGGELGVNVYLVSLVQNLANSATSKDGRYTLNLDIEDHLFSIDKLQILGLIVNELVTNIIKHAYDPKEGGLIEVSLKRQKRIFKLEVNDYGSKATSGGSKEKNKGINLIELLVKQLKGKITSRSENGMKFTITFN
ncbi:MAG: histidine kinase dimerization/phosphoacceptor domain -containing protein [Cyclobacteriaceae bacterium]